MSRPGNRDTDGKPPSGPDAVWSGRGGRAAAIAERLTHGASCYELAI